MSVDEDQLRAESDATLAALETIRELEERKRHLSPDSPDFVSAAHQVRELSRILERTALRQAELAEAVADAAEENDVLDRPIVDVPAPEGLPAILAAWRTAERRLAEARPGSAEEEDLQDAVRRLRAAYAEAHEQTTKTSTGLSDD